MKISKTLLVETINEVQKLLYENIFDQKYYMFVNNWDGLRNYYEILLKMRNAKFLNVIKVLSQNPDSGKTANEKANFVLDTMTSVLAKRKVLDFTEEGKIIAVVAANHDSCMDKSDKHFRKIFMLDPPQEPEEPEPIPAPTSQPTPPPTSSPKIIKKRSPKPVDKGLSALINKYLKRPH